MSRFKIAVFSAALIPIFLLQFAVQSNEVIECSGSDLPPGDRRDDKNFLKLYKKVGPLLSQHAGESAVVSNAEERDSTLESTRSELIVLDQDIVFLPDWYRCEDLTEINDQLSGMEYKAYVIDAIANFEGRLQTGMLTKIDPILSVNGAIGTRLRQEALPMCSVWSAFPFNIQGVKLNLVLLDIFIARINLRCNGTPSDQNSYWKVLESHGMDNNIILLGDIISDVYVESFFISRDYGDRPNWFLESLADSIRFNLVTGELDLIHIKGSARTSPSEGPLTSKMRLYSEEFLTPVMASQNWDDRIQSLIYDVRLLRHDLEYSMNEVTGFAIVLDTRFELTREAKQINNSGSIDSNVVLIVVWMIILSLGYLITAKR